MTDPQLIKSSNHNNSNSNNNSVSNYNQYNHGNRNNNNDNEEPKYLHKKFKKMATSEITKNNELNIANSNTIPSYKTVADFENKTSFFNHEVKETKESIEFRKSSYVCPYCKLSCNKPSVLLKHIRAHTNERPYPCVPCGFSFKTKSNLYKHCRSKTHIMKMEGSDTSKILQSHLSEESDLSLSDSASNGTGTPPLSIQSTIPLMQHVNPPSSSPNMSPSSSLSPSPCSSPNLRLKISTKVKIYKPKFHTVLKQNTASDSFSKLDILQISKRTENINTNNCFMQNKRSEKIEHRKHDSDSNSVESLLCSDYKLIDSSMDNYKLHKKDYCKEHSDLQYKTEPNITDASDFQSNCECESVVNVEYNCSVNDMQPMSSPGPLLGNTRLVDSHCIEMSKKRPRLEPFSKYHIVEKHKKYSVPNALQMFGGEVSILDNSGESKTLRIEPRITSCSSNCPNNSQGNSETTSIIRSSLHSGGTMLHKPVNIATSISQTENDRKKISFTNIAPIISPPTITPNIVPNFSCFDYLKPLNILHAGKLIPYVPGIPGPQSLPTNSDITSLVLTTTSTIGIENEIIKSVDISSSSNLVNKFVRPSSLPLKPGTFTPKRHHGITPTLNTLPLISPETPRHKKSYGQLYLNGHAYTYLGLKCSTRLFYCTLNRPQPMYVTQQNGLSMYSNWKICKETPSDVDLTNYDSRHRLAGYTLANSQYKDILTHSSQRSNTPNSPDSGLESDSQEKNKRIKIFDGGFESNEDYTYIRGRGRGRYVCEECGIRCKKPSMLKKHIKTHTDVRPYTCKYCAFSFKTKGNLTKHMKSKAHYKKCIETKILPVFNDENMNKKMLNYYSKNKEISDETSSSEESELETETGADFEAEAETDDDESEESANEEHEAAQSLLRLARTKGCEFPGLTPFVRPNTYPYELRSCLVTSTHQPIQLESSTTSGKNLLPRSSDLSIRVSSQFTEIHKAEKQEKVAVPIDLTIKHSESEIKNYNSIDILTTVSGPELLTSIVQTMERLPVQNRNEWLTEYTNKDMFRAYLTERYMMDNKMKQQYRTKAVEKDVESYLVRPPNTLTSPIINDDKIINVTTDSEKLNYNSFLKPNFNQNSDINCCTLPNDIENKSVKDPVAGLKKIGLKTSHIIPKPSISEKIEELSKNKSLHSFSKQCSKSMHQNLTLVLEKTVQHQSKPNKIGFPDVQSTSLCNAINNEKPEFFQQSIVNTSGFVSIAEDTRNICNICNKIFSKPSQLRLHINIHYFERPFRCESCGTSFRTKGHLTKHERSTLHQNKVSMTSTFGTATSTNPRPFKCTDCKSAFRIHGHLAKHLRSKMHIMKLECLRKLPFGIYAEIERSGINLNNIDTTDCDTSLTSLQIMAQKLYEKDPGKLGQWDVDTSQIISCESSSEDDATLPHFKSDEIDETYKLNKTLCNKKNDLNLLNINVGKISNRLLHKCHLCLLSFQNLNELHKHQVTVHKIESNILSDDIQNYIRTNVEKKQNTRVNLSNDSTICKGEEQIMDAT